MPNWCDCELEVSYPYKNDMTKEDIDKATDELQRFKEFAAGENGVLDMNKFVPYPKDMEYNMDGYNWCCENWGTKWNFSDPQLTQEDLKYFQSSWTFQTAWSPPEPVIKAMGELFPLLNFDLRYFEQGMAFNGILCIKQGSITEAKTAEYFGHRGG